MVVRMRACRFDRGTPIQWYLITASIPQAPLVFIKLNIRSSNLLVKKDAQKGQQVDLLRVSVSRVGDG